LLIDGSGDSLALNYPKTGANYQQRAKTNATLSKMLPTEQNRGKGKIS